jgi:universal stress protein E
VAESRRLLVIVDPTSDAQPAAERAVWLAERLGGTVELFICDYDQHLAGERFYDSDSLQTARGALIDGHLRRLRELARSIDTHGVALSVDARWDHPVSKGIDRKVLEVKPYLVVKDTHYHSAIKRSILSNTDWNLIQNCPAPLLLVKPRAISDKPCVMAAVDPVHAHDKPAELDHQILSCAEELCVAAEGQLHVFHAFDPAPAIAAATTTMVTPIYSPVSELTEELKQRHRKALDDLLEEHPLGSLKLHVHQGSPQELLISLAEHIKADFVVMGAVSRSGLKRVFIGSTAERVLDRLPCDLLIVKPDQKPLRQKLE